MAQGSPMNGGDGIYSYAMNSSIQRDGLIVVKEAMKKALIENLDLKTVLSGSNKFTIVDLGCSVGPNTFFAMLPMQTIVETIEGLNLDQNQLEFQVFFNDQTSNDFNTLFASLPCQRKYFAYGAPGSFYDRLSPSSSIHFVYSSYALHWLSKLPNELQMKISPAWNEGRIHYTGAPDAVVKAYADQYEKDINVFLCARAEEIVQGGMMVIIMPGVPDGTLMHYGGINLDFIGSILMDMGILEKDKVDSFNFPHVYPCIKEVTRLVEKNGYFRMVKIELGNSNPDPKVSINIESTIKHIRALTEGTIANHLGTDHSDHKITDEIFTRAMHQKTKLAHMLGAERMEIGCQLFAVLERK